MKQMRAKMEKDAAATIFALRTATIDSLNQLRQQMEYEHRMFKGEIHGLKSELAKRDLIAHQELGRLRRELKLHEERMRRKPHHSHNPHQSR